MSFGFNITHKWSNNQCMYEVLWSNHFKILWYELTSKVLRFITVRLCFFGIIWTVLVYYSFIIRKEFKNKNAIFEMKLRVHYCKESSKTLTFRCKIVIQAVVVIWLIKSCWIELRKNTLFTLNNILLKLN